jgi:SNF2 family DNA or RNA helicase
MKPIAELVDDRIFLWTKFDYKNMDRYKRIIGYKWEPDVKGRPWSYPLSTAACVTLREIWGAELEVGKDLARWYRREMTATRDRQELLANDAPLDRIRQSHPDVYDAIQNRHWQGPGVEFLRTLNVSGNLDEPGLGKTLMALATVIEAGRWEGRHLVICPPAAIMSTWHDEISKWTPDAKVYPMPESSRARRQKNLDAFLADEDGARFLIVHPWMLQIRRDRYCAKCKQWMSGPLVDPEFDKSKHYEEVHNVAPKDSKVEWPQLYDVKWDSILADEAHQYMLKLRPPSSQNQPQWAYGLIRLAKCMAPDGIRHPMTGTPFRGKEERLFGMLYWLDPAKYSSFWRWAEARFDVQKEEHNRYGATHNTILGLTDAGRKLFYDDLDRYFLRRTRREVRPNDPEPVEAVHWIRMSDKQMETYKDFEETSVALIEEGVLEGRGRLSEIMRLRQLSFGDWRMEDDQTIEPIATTSNKVAFLDGILKEMGIFGDAYSEDASKVIVASNFTKILLALGAYYRAIGVPTLSIHGGVKGRRRDAAKSSFQEDPLGPKIMLLHTTTGGVSLNLDRYCDDLFMLDESWVHDDQVQLIGRINNRSGLPRTRYVHRLLSKDTVEEGIFLGNTRQRDMQSDILDARRGKEVALSLIKERASRA